MNTLILDYEKTVTWQGIEISIHEGMEFVRSTGYKLIIKEIYRKYNTIFIKYDFINGTGIQSPNTHIMSIKDFQVWLYIMKPKTVIK